MKQYVIDQLRPEDHEKIKKYLDENFGPTRVDGIYWIPVDKSVLSNVQSEHTECQPFFIAVDLEPSTISWELLVRTRNRIRCSCVSYANAIQREWIVQLADAMFDTLDIKI